MPARQARGLPLNPKMNASTATISAPSTQDALELLTAEHRQLEALFTDCSRAATGEGGAADRAGLLGRLAVRLRAHETIERELFYPALEGALGAEVVAAAAQQHERIDAQLEAIASAESEQAHALGELRQQFRLHVQHEERVLFAAAAAGLDLHELGTRLAVRRAALLGADEGAD